MADHDGRRQLPIMVRQAKKSQKPDWPLMELWGLHRRSIEADGNCLFRALSDQLYNSTERHDEIRCKVVSYLRSNRAHFEPFVLANVEENLVRSQPTTRSSRSRKSSIDHDAFEIYLENMAKPNTWGGEIEITAFCEAFDRDVLIHRPTDAECPFNRLVNSKRVAGQPKVFLHISFGDEESFPHYDSVRPVKAPSASTPLTAKSTSTTKGALYGPSERHLSLNGYRVDPLKQIQDARSRVSQMELHAFLEDSRNHLNQTFADMINADRESSSASSASRRSSSSKRSREEDDDDDGAPKRALRRSSLRNKTRAFVACSMKASSANGTEMTFNIRVDTPPSTSTESESFSKRGTGGEQQKASQNERRQVTKGKQGQKEGVNQKGRTRSRVNRA